MENVLILIYRSYRHNDMIKTIICPIRAKLHVSLRQVWFNNGYDNIEILFLNSYASERIYFKNMSVKTLTQCMNEFQD